MAYASLLAGMAFNNANLGYVHAMAHQLGGLYDMPHGVANAVLLPHVARYNLIANPEKFADIAELMGENITGLSTLDAAEKAIAAITRLSMDIGIPQHLRDLGVKEADFPYMAEMALKDGNAFSNPRKGNEQEIAAIFRRGILSVNEGAVMSLFTAGAYACFTIRAGTMPAPSMSCAGAGGAGGPLPDHNL